MSDSNANLVLHRSEDHKVNISTMVHYIFFAIGLFIEYSAIFHLPNFQSIKIDEILWVKLSVIFLLIHQFIAIINFHIIDHSPKGAIKSLGKWITDFRFERFFRTLIFITLLCLTGEMIYLLLVSSEFTELSKKLITFINISESARFYIISSSIITFLITLWTLCGLAIELKIKRPKASWISNVDQPIISVLSDNPYISFLLSDLIGLYLWIMTTLIALGNLMYAKYMFFLCFPYFALIGFRLVVGAVNYLRKLMITNKTERATLWDNEKIRNYQNYIFDWGKYKNILKARTILFVLLIVYFLCNFAIQLSSYLGNKKNNSQINKKKYAKEQFDKANRYFIQAYADPEYLDSAYHCYKEAQENDTIYNLAGCDCFRARLDSLRATPWLSIYPLLKDYTQKLCSRSQVER